MPRWKYKTTIADMELVIVPEDIGRNPGQAGGVRGASEQRGR